ncbi:hypothetical protein PYCC9005_001848 [Savitreella phatthalungensis]
MLRYTSNNDVRSPRRVGGTHRSSTSAVSLDDASLRRLWQSSEADPLTPTSQVPARALSQTVPLTTPVRCVSARERSMSMPSSRAGVVTQRPLDGGALSFYPPSQQVTAFGHINTQNLPHDTADDIVFVIKSFTEADVAASVLYEVWSSNEVGNWRLDRAWREGLGWRRTWLAFSVNGSGRFCGVAELVGGLEDGTLVGVWERAGGRVWEGHFRVRWHTVVDLPTTELTHIQIDGPTPRTIARARDTHRLEGRSAQQLLDAFRIARLRPPFIDNLLDRHIDYLTYFPR